MLLQRKLFRLIKDRYPGSIGSALKLLEFKYRLFRWVRGDSFTARISLMSEAEAREILEHVQPDSPVTEERVDSFRSESERFRQSTLIWKERLIRDGFTPLEGIVDVRASSQLRESLAEGHAKIFVGWHHGPCSAINLGLFRLGIPLLKIVGSDFLGRWPENWTVYDLASRKPTELLKHAVNAIRSGRSVFLLPDIYDEPGEFIVDKIAGIPFRLTQGFVALAELTGAEVIPVTAHWNRSRTRILVEFHDAMKSSRESTPSSDFSCDLMREYSAMLHRSITSHPDEIVLGRMRDLKALEDSS